MGIKRNNSRKICIAIVDYYNRRVLAHHFLLVVGGRGMLWRKKNEFMLQENINKLSPKWEWPYKVVVIQLPSVYVLEDM